MDDLAEYCSISDIIPEEQVSKSNFKHLTGVAGVSKLPLINILYKNVGTI